MNAIPGKLGNPWLGKRLWATDSETHLIQPGLLTPPGVCGSWAIGDIYFDENGNDTPTEGVTSFPRWLDDLERALLSNVVIVGANIAYDFGVACAARPYLLDLVFAKYERDEVFDVLIAEALIDIHRGLLFVDPVTYAKFERYSLALVGARWLGVDMSADKNAANPDAWRLKYALLEHVPMAQWPTAALEYPIRDARYTYDTAVKQIADGRNLHDMGAQARAAWALHCSAVWGMRTDAVWVEKFSAEVEEKHHLSRAKFLAAGLLKVKRAGKNDDEEAIDTEALIAAIGGEPKGARRDELLKALEDVDAGRRMRYSGDKKALAARVTEAYAGTPPTSDKGNVKGDKDTLKESGDDLLVDFAASGENEKFFTTYLSVLRQGARVPINPETNVLVATGRCSYRKPNLQNLPRGGHVREGFIVRPGMVLCSLDYPTLELRTLAHSLEQLIGWSKMADALRKGVDLHTKLAGSILNTPYEALLQLVEAEEQQATDFRQMAKAGNFGLPGGLGPVKLVAYARQSYNARLCLLAGVATKCGEKKFVDRRSNTSVCAACYEVAVKLKDTWFATWPEMEGYFNLVTQWTSVETEFHKNADGEEIKMDVGAIRQLGSGRVRGRCTFTNGCNTVFQGLAADIAKRAMWLVSKESYTDLDSPLWGSRIVAFVHDELLMELPEERMHDAAFRAAALMNKAGSEACPTLPWDVRPAVARRWFKKMSEVYDADGRLAVWEPKPAKAA